MLEYIKLMRLNQPAGFFLVFWPASFGLLLGSDGNIPWHLLGLFFIGAIIVRGAGCIINDIIDKDFDKHVERTKNRPIAKGTISVLNGALFCAFLSLLSLTILLSLSKEAIYAGLSSVMLIVIYPFMKRVTNYPQAFLALTFNMGCTIGYLTLQPHISWNFILLYAACMFWTLGYDTIYGYQDRKYDKKIGVKSTAITFEKRPKLALSFFYIMMITCLVYLGKIEDFSWPYYFFIALAALHLSWQILSLDTENPQNCGARFKSNMYLGAMLFVGFLLTKISF